MQCIPAVLPSSFLVPSCLEHNTSPMIFIYWLPRHTIVSSAGSPVCSALDPPRLGVRKYWLGPAAVPLPHQLHVTSMHNPVTIKQLRNNTYYRTQQNAHNGKHAILKQHGITASRTHLQLWDGPGYRKIGGNFNEHLEMRDIARCNAGRYTCSTRSAPKSVSRKNPGLQVVCSWQKSITALSAGQENSIHSGES